MAEYHFYGMVSRMKYIARWGLMRNTVPENDMEHSMQTALIAHGLAVLGKTRHQRDIDPAHVVVLALYHDVGEVITGDLPTPVKYKTPGIQDAYAAVEADARSQLMDMLPEDMLPALCRSQPDHLRMAAGQGGGPHQRLPQVH